MVAEEGVGQEEDTVTAMTSTAQTKRIEGREGGRKEGEEYNLQREKM
jgi:hypothetical protein